MSFSLFLFLFLFPFSNHSLRNKAEKTGCNWDYCLSIPSCFTKKKRVIVESGVITDQLKLFLFSDLSFDPLSSKLLLRKWLDSLQGCVHFSHGLAFYIMVLLVWFGKGMSPAALSDLRLKLLHTCPRENMSSPCISRRKGRPQARGCAVPVKAPQASAEQSFAAGVCSEPKTPRLLCEHVQCVLVGVRSTSHTALPGGNTILREMVPCIPFL